MFIHRFDRLPSPKPLHSKGYDTNWKGRQRVSGNIRNSSRGEHNAISYIYIYIHTRYESNEGLGSLPAAYRFLFQLSFLRAFPIVRRKYRIENWFLTRRPRLNRTLPPPTTSYLQREWRRADISLVNRRFRIYTFSSSLESLCRRSFCCCESLRWENVKIVSISMKQGRGGSKRKLEQMFELFALKFYYSTLWLDGGACGLIDSIKFKSDCLNLNWQVNCLELWG